MSALKLETVNENIGILELNRAEVYNALTKDDKLEVIKAIRNFNKDPKIRAIILKASGKAFCTGQNLHDRTVKAGEKPVDLGVTLETEWNPLINSIVDSKVPVICAINGVCAGAGISVALSCDLIVSKDKVKFISGFSKLGLCPDAGANYTFVRSFGYQKALEFFYFNEPLLSEDLQRVGIINYVGEDYEQKAMDYATKISKLASDSTQIIKKNAQAARDTNFQGMLTREVASQRYLGNSEDYKEGLAAFFEKREANFSKKEMH